MSDYSSDDSNKEVKPKKLKKLKTRKIKKPEKTEKIKKPEKPKKKDIEKDDSEFSDTPDVPLKKKTTKKPTKKKDSKKISKPKKEKVEKKVSKSKKEKVEKKVSKPKKEKVEKKKKVKESDSDLEDLEDLENFKDEIPADFDEKLRLAAHSFAKDIGGITFEDAYSIVLSENLSYEDLIKNYNLDNLDDDSNSVPVIQQQPFIQQPFSSSSINNLVKFDDWENMLKLDDQTLRMVITIMSESVLKYESGGGPYPNVDFVISLANDRVKKYKVEKVVEKVVEEVVEKVSEEVKTDDQADKPNEIIELTDAEKKQARLDWLDKMQNRINNKE